MVAHLLSLTPFRRIVKDYFMVCDSYYAGDPYRDAGPDRGDRHGPAGAARRGLATLLERLKGKVEIDFDTARRLFTLISVLHWKG